MSLTKPRITLAAMAGSGLSIPFLNLIAGAVFFVQKARGEINGGVIDDPGFLIGEKLFVAAVRGDEAAGGWGVKGRKGRKGRRGAARSLWGRDF